MPPPGYFNDFSGHVIARIRAGERVDRSGFWESLSWEAPWLQRLWSAFETKPIFAGALGMVVCGFLVTGVVYSQRLPEVASESTTTTGTQVAAQNAQKDGTPILGVVPQASFASSIDGVRPDAMLINFSTH